MNAIKSGDFTGFSNTSINEAFQNALEKAGDPPRFSVVETIGVHNNITRKTISSCSKT